jgi:transposase
MDTEHSAIAEPVHRLEVFTGAGRRRTWRNEEKARIVAEIAIRRAAGPHYKHCEND